MFHFKERNCAIFTIDKLLPNQLTRFGQLCLAMQVFLLFTHKFSKNSYKLKCLPFSDRSYSVYIPSEPSSSFISALSAFEVFYSSHQRYECEQTFQHHLNCKVSLSFCGKKGIDRWYLCLWGASTDRLRHQQHFEIFAKKCICIFLNYSQSLCMPPSGKSYSARVFFPLVKKFSVSH